MTTTAETFTEQMSYKQTTKIRLLCNELGLNARVESETRLGVDLDSLSRRGASKLIDSLEAEKAKRKTAPRPNQLEALKAIMAKREEKKAPAACLWCKEILAGNLTSTAIPKPSAAMCLEHHALNVEWSRRMCKLDANLLPVEDDEALVAEIVERGISIVKARQVAA